MIILTTPGWSDYELLDTGNGQKLEKFGSYILIRPDPQILWQPHLASSDWAKADARFDGKWQVRSEMPKKWLIHYKN